MNPHRFVHDLKTGTTTQIELSDREWADDQDRAALVAAETAARPKVVTMEDRISAIELALRNAGYLLN